MFCAEGVLDALGMSEEWLVFSAALNQTATVRILLWADLCRKIVHDFSVLNV